MDSIIFLSKKAKSYFTDERSQENQIVDYFDIEVQKVLSYLKYNYKNHPIIIDAEKIYDSKKHRCFDLENFEYIFNLKDSDFASYLCVIYNCY